MPDYINSEDIVDDNGNPIAVDDNGNPIGASTKKPTPVTNDWSGLGGLKSGISRLYETINYPLAGGRIQKLASNIAEEIEKPRKVYERLGPLERGVASWRGFAAGALGGVGSAAEEKMGGLGNFGEGIATPAGIATLGLGTAEAQTARNAQNFYRARRLKDLAQIGRITASAPALVHGTAEVARPDATMQERASGGMEALMGAAGTFAPTPKLNVQTKGVPFKLTKPGPKPKVRLQLEAGTPPITPATFIVGRAGAAINKPYVQGGRVVTPYEAASRIPEIIKDSSPVVIRPEFRGRANPVRAELRKQGYTRGSNLQDGSEQWHPPTRETEVPPIEPVSGANIPEGNIVDDSGNVIPRPDRPISALPPKPVVAKPVRELTAAEEINLTRIKELMGVGKPNARQTRELSKLLNDNPHLQERALQESNRTKVGEKDIFKGIDAKDLGRIRELYKKAPTGLTAREQAEIRRLNRLLKPEQFDEILRETGALPEKLAPPPTPPNIPPRVPPNLPPPTGLPPGRPPVVPPAAGPISSIMPEGPPASSVVPKNTPSGAVPAINPEIPTSAAEISDTGITGLGDRTTPVDPRLEALKQEIRDGVVRERTAPIINPITNEPVSSAVRTGKGTGNSRDRIGTARTGEADRQGVIGKVIKGLEEAKPLRVEQKLAYSQERARRFQKIRRTRKRGEAGHIKRLTHLQGELPHVTFQSIRDQFDQGDIDTLYDIIWKAPFFTEGEKARAGQGLAKMLGEYGGHVPQDGEIRLLSQMFGYVNPALKEPFLKASKTAGPAFFDTGMVYAVNQGLGINKTLMSSMDMSAPGRQAFPLWHTKAYWNSWKPMFKSWSSPEYYNNAIKTIREDPYYKYAERDGLPLADLTIEAEEAFSSRIVKRIIPGIAASERSYNIFLNKVRFDHYKTMLKIADGLGMDWRSNEPLRKNIVDFISTSTGRGKLASWDAHVSKLNEHFFSPRLMFSRIQMLNPTYYMDLTGNPKTWHKQFTPEQNFIRKEKLKTIALMGAFVSTVNTLGYIAGMKVETDPNSADFGKLHHKNFRLDMGAGLLQYLTFYHRIFSGVRKSSLTGRQLVLGSRYGYPTRFDVSADFAISKTSPLTSLAARALKGKSAQGGPVDWNKEYRERVTPIFLSDAYDVINEDPWSAAWLLPAFFGAGVQIYGKERSYGGSSGQTR